MDTIWVVHYNLQVPYLCPQYVSFTLSEEDNKRRKGLTTDSYKAFESTFSSKHVSEKVKIRVFPT